MSETHGKNSRRRLPDTEPRLRIRGTRSREYLACAFLVICTSQMSDEEGWLINFERKNWSMLKQNVTYPSRPKCEAH